MVRHPPPGRRFPVQILSIRTTGHAGQCDQASPRRNYRPLVAEPPPTASPLATLDFHETRDSSRGAPVPLSSFFVAKLRAVGAWSAQNDDKLSLAGRYRPKCDPGIIMGSERPRRFKDNQALFIAWSFAAERRYTISSITLPSMNVNRSSRPR
jgi:hypothetical protein